MVCWCASSHRAGWSRWIRPRRSRSWPDDHGNGLIELTSRGNLQLRGVRGATLDALTSALDALGLLDTTPEAEAVRNVISSPLAGIDVTAFDTRPIVKALEQGLTGDCEIAGLSDKFGFLVDGGGLLPLDDIEADIRFVWTGDHFAIGLARESGCDWIGVCSPERRARCGNRLGSRFPQPRRQRPARSSSFGCASGIKSARQLASRIGVRPMGLTPYATLLSETAPTPRSNLLLTVSPPHAVISAKAGIHASFRGWHAAGSRASREFQQRRAN